MGVSLALLYHVLSYPFWLSPSGNPFEATHSLNAITTGRLRYLATSLHSSLSWSHHSSLVYLDFCLHFAPYLMIKTGVGAKAIVIAPSVVKAQP